MGENPHIYFIYCKEVEAIKIGISFCPDMRLDDMIPHCPCDLKIIGFIENGGQYLERDLHEEFADDKIHHEWFRATPRLMRFIEVNTKKWKFRSFD